LLLPFNYFYPLPGGIKPVGCLTVIFSGIFIFCVKLKKGILEDGERSLSKKGLFILVASYAVIFGSIAALRHLNYQNTSSFDVALYNQIQWNNIHGRFFQSSISGSNFVTHNSPFLILLSPFYAVYPHPITLIALKSLFLALSAIPFYLILGRIVHRGAVLPLMLGYLFYPFIVGQNFNAPHEVCFLPPFLLFSFYFFLTGRFKNFIIFLLFSLSIKEHIALIAVMYGIYACFLKREKKWIVTPILLGVLWGIFSIWIIYYFQKLYNVDPYPAWLIENIKDRFIRPETDVLSGIWWGLKTSNLRNSNSLCSIYSLFSPVGVILPFFSLVMFLGMPELMINLVASIPLIYPEWHYNIVVACFILIGCVMTIKRLSEKIFKWKEAIKPYQTQVLLAWFLCFCVMSHFFFWWDYTVIRQKPRYVQTMNAAIRLIPDKASVSAPKRLVAYVSNRRDYFLMEDKRKGDYIVTDDSRGIKGHFSDKKQADRYITVFEKEGIFVYKKSGEL